MDIYTAGYLASANTFDFGNGVTTTIGSRTSTIVVKYNSSGVAQWAKSTAIDSPGDSYFNDIAIDANSNVYAAGYTLNSSSVYDFGNGVTTSGANASRNALVVKYNSSGVAQWANSTALGGPGTSSLTGIDVDSNNNIYVSGWMNSTGTFNFGNNVTVTGGNASTNTLLVKYNSSGVAQWAKSTAVGAPGYSAFWGITVDSINNLYLAGEVDSTTPFDFGNGVTVTGEDAGAATIVKYNSDGLAQWAKSTVQGNPNYSYYSSISINSSGNLYAVGEIDSTTPFDFGNGVTVAGGNSGSNALIVKYEPDSVSTPTNLSESLNLSLASPAHCADFTPENNPDLFKINKTDTTATLYFTSVKSPAYKYYVSYGLFKDTLGYGVEFINNTKGVLSYKINHLTPNTRYYFKIRGGNGCMPGPWSNVLSVKTAGSVSNDTVEEITLPTPTSIPTLVPTQPISTPLPSLVPPTSTSVPVKETVIGSILNFLLSLFGKIIK